MTLDENQLWLLSYYRNSELSGALFFGQLARSLRPSPIQCDMTRHFADEAQHARYWTECIERLGARPLKLQSAYQDRYLAAAGMPANLMEVLAITQIFERRVVAQYALHRRAPDLPSPVAETLDRIIDDERWHLEWIRAALAGMQAGYGREGIDAALRRCAEADRSVYREVVQEHAARLDHLPIARR